MSNDEQNADKLREQIAALRAAEKARDEVLFARIRNAPPSASDLAEREAMEGFDFGDDS